MLERRASLEYERAPAPNAIRSIMKISIEGTTFTIKGNLSVHGSAKKLGARLVAAGGSVKSSITPATQVFILGESWAYTPEGVREKYGIPVLDEDQVTVLLSTGELEVELSTQSQTLDGVLGDVRGLLDGELSAARWQALTELIDTCSGEELPALVEYIDAQLDRREAHPGFDAKPLTAPASWLLAACKGDRSPKYQIARSITLGRNKMNSTVASKLLKEDVFPKLRALDVRVSKPSASLFKAIAKAPVAPRLTTMGLTQFQDKNLKGLIDDHGLDQLTHLQVQYHKGDYDRSALEALLTSSWCERVTTLTVSGFARGFAEILEGTQGSLPNLKHVIVNQAHMSFGPDSASLIQLFRPLESIKLRYWFAIDHEYVEEFCQQTFDHIALLDLGGLEIHHPSLPDAQVPEAHIEQWIAKLVDILPGSPLAKSVRSLALGRWAAPQLIDAIQAAREISSVH